MEKPNKDGKEKEIQSSNDNIKEDKKEKEEALNKEKDEEKGKSL